MIGALIEETDVQLTTLSIPAYVFALAVFGAIVLTILLVIVFGRSRRPRDD